MENYSAIKRNYWYTLWAYFRNIMLGERSKTQDTIYCMITFIECPGEAHLEG